MFSPGKDDRHAKPYRSGRKHSSGSSGKAPKLGGKPGSIQAIGLSRAADNFNGESLCPHACRPSARSSGRTQRHPVDTRRMDSSANSLINPDARMGLAGAQPGAGAAGTVQAGGAADLGGLGGMGGNFTQRLSGLAQMRGNPRAPLVFAVALLVAVVAGLFLWSRSPDYKVLYSNLSDRDGGSIIAALQQANIPYKLSDSGGAILVPAEQVHEMRL